VVIGLQADADLLSRHRLFRSLFSPTLPLCRPGSNLRPPRSGVSRPLRGPSLGT
jgi:hypothetical protein